MKSVIGGVNVEGSIVYNEVTAGFESLGACIIIGDFGIYVKCAIINEKIIAGIYAIPLR